MFLYLFTHTGDFHITWCACHFKK